MKIVAGIASGSGVEESGMCGQKRKRCSAFRIYHFVLFKFFTFFAGAFNCLITKTDSNFFEAHTMCCK